MAMSPREVPDHLNTIFKRGCLECPDTTPSCPSCPSGQVCSLVPQSCNQCAYMTCVGSGATNGNPKSSGPNVGAIAGGVIGGVVLVAAVCFLLWWFWLRPRRRNLELEEIWEAEDEEDDAATQKSHRFQPEQNPRSSFASAMTRASNVIQIAFIPGVTNQSGTNSMHSTATPPVPPIPAARNQSPSPYNSRNDQDAIYFGPSDLRNSAYSNTSSLANRSTCIGRPSISPSLARESVASEMYRDGAPTPAQTVMRARPNMVSVKSSTSGGKTAPSPIEEVPSPDGASPRDFASPVSAVTSPASLSQSNSFRGKPTAVNIVKNKGRFPVRQDSDASATTPHKPKFPSPLAGAGAGDETDDTDTDDDPHVRARQSLLRSKRSSVASGSIQETPVDHEGGPFSDIGSRISIVIADATRRASRSNPFGDEHRSE